jgi:NAD(P)-dependent dehydrogenase (short-subunit alcohol dehydrogenase family)
VGKSMTEGKVALVTGISSGIWATARLLLGRGFRVFGTIVLRKYLLSFTSG